MAIAEDTQESFAMTNRANTVAVITDGSEVLGQGNIGPEAAMPVMEGKAALFKRLAGIDAIPIVGKAFQVQLNCLKHVHLGVLLRIARRDTAR